MHEICKILILDYYDQRSEYLIIISVTAATVKHITLIPSLQDCFIIHSLLAFWHLQYDYTLEWSAEFHF